VYLRSKPRGHRAWEQVGISSPHGPGVGGHQLAAFLSSYQSFSKRFRDAWVCGACVLTMWIPAGLTAAAVNCWEPVPLAVRGAFPHALSDGPSAPIDDGACGGALPDERPAPSLPSLAAIELLAAHASLRLSPVQGLAAAVGSGALRSGWPAGAGGSAESYFV